MSNQVPQPAVGVDDAEDELLADEPLDNASAGRVGKAVEYLVAASCILTTRGELNVSTSMVDDEGVDLVFFARGSTATLAVQVKSRTTDSKQLRDKARFGAVVREATFAPRDDLDMLFVVADAVEGRYKTAWLVPSPVFAEKAHLRANGTRRFVASVKPDSNDKWRPYRLEREELPGALLSRLRTIAGAS